jgi:enoyl-CoA hydratase
MPDTLLVDRDGRTAIITLNRPQQRNALSTEVLRALRDAMAAAEADDAVDVVILTGADPAFSAGLDLKELGSTGANLGAGGPARDTAEPEPASPWARLTKPVIGAINGAAVTGGFELALHCDLLVASERAKFGDTHARVGVMPGWGLSVLLPQAVGVRKAKEMSLTGNFLSAEDALRLGLVNHVVRHEDLLKTALSLAADIGGNDQRGVRALLDEYKQTTVTTVADGLRIEARLARSQHGGVDPAEVERRRQAIIDRGRSQV